jgi:hypothetical protein
MRKTVRKAGKTATTLNLHRRSPVKLLSRKTSATSWLAGTARRHAITRHLHFRKPKRWLPQNKSVITPLVSAEKGIAIRLGSRWRKLTLPTSKGMALNDVP